MMRAWLLVLCALVGGGTARAQVAPPLGPFPQIAVDVDMSFYGIGTPGASDLKRRGTSGFLFGHIAAGLYLSPTLSIQGFLHPDPAGGFEPNGANTLFRRQGLILEQLYLNWEPRPGLAAFGGKFNAPFGYGYDFFPGVLASFRAHDVYLIKEQLGVGGTATVLSHPNWGEHAITAAAFTLDTSFLANNVSSFGKCCDEGFERYRRTSLREGGPGNTGRLDSFAVALDGDGFGYLPSFTYHAAVLSRAPGKDGNRREWALAVGARYEAAWTPALRTLFFGEWVRFRNSGGGLFDAVAPTFTEEGEEILGEEVRVAERRQFSTLGAQTRLGRWRTTLAWQRDQIKRSVNPTPQQNWIELSVGTDIGWGFGIDVGYQYARFGRAEGSLGQTNSLVGRLNFRQSF